uniref:Uncharacterized protein n=1 Tax=Globisporangium ultimum (strain ATCC 200006 / CBS 805.95 / DAOM BR144) TaxID=431595 RepID=K3WGT6_GLOUD
MSIFVRTFNAVTSAAYGPEDLSSGMGTPPSILPEYEWFWRSLSLGETYSLDASAALGKLSNA